MIQLTERLKEVSDRIIDVWYTDYVGDVCNLIMNKPRVYRIIYYKPQDIWCISIAYEYIHCDLLDLLQNNGIIDVRQDGYKNAWEAYQDEDASYCFKFVPHGMEKESGADWDKIIRLTTGQLQMSYNVRMWQDDYRLNRVGCHGPEFAEEFIDKLESIGAFDFDDPDEYDDYDDDDELEESVKLSEGLKNLYDNIWYTNYVGDICNWLVNKPKFYRVVYCTSSDIWCICDALYNTHSDMVAVLDEAGLISIDADGYDDYSDARFSDSYIAFEFAPSGGEHELTGYYSRKYAQWLQLESGILATERPDLDSPAYRDMFNKLSYMGAVVGRESVTESATDTGFNNLCEGLKEVTGGIWYSDYAGDIANFILNKPKPYRVIYIYDDMNDIWFIADSYKYTHVDMLCVADENDIIQFDYDKYDDIFDWIKDMDSYRMEGDCRFIPDGDEYKKEFNDAYYPFPIKIETGYMMLRDIDDMGGVFSDLLKVFVQRKAISEDELNRIDCDFDTLQQESLLCRRLSEKLEEINDDSFYTDYVGDICNWIVNKPKVYRILYYAPADVWCISDAVRSIHYDMILNMNSAGVIDLRADGFSDCFDAFNDDATTTAMFVPYGKESELSDRYRYNAGVREPNPNTIYLSSGILALSSYDYEFNQDVFNELLRKLNSIGAVVDKEPVTESLSLTEGLDEVDDDVFCTDYVGDIANFIINKPKVYRVIYYAPSDIWGIGDAIRYTHDDILGILQECGCVDVTADGYSDVIDAYYSGDCIRFTFAPNGKETEINWRYIKNAVKLSSGIIVPDCSDSMTYGGGLELYNKLKSMGALVVPDSMQESLMLAERLDEIAPECYCTDYVGDVVNWFINKPKPYRFVYDDEHGIWCVADANTWLHDDMAEEMIGSGYVQLTEQEITTINDWFSRKYNTAKYNPPFKVKAQMYGYGPAGDWFAGGMFVPNGSDFEDEGTDTYTEIVPIESGNILLLHKDELSGYGVFRDLYYNLKNRNAFPDYYDIDESAT